MEDYLLLVSVSVGWLGAFAIAATLFKRFWRDEVTTLKLFGFLAAFSVCFVGVVMICVAIGVQYVDFGR